MVERVQRQRGTLGHEIWRDGGTILAWAEDWCFHLSAVWGVDLVPGCIDESSTNSSD